MAQCRTRRAHANFACRVGTADQTLGINRNSGAAFAHPTAEALRQSAAFWQMNKALSAMPPMRGMALSTASRLESLTATFGFFSSR